MEPISSLSREYIYVSIEGATGGEGVEIAFTVPGIEPVELEWKAAEWHAPSKKGYDAKVLVGPGTAMAWTNGSYQAWARITGPIEQPVLPGGVVPVT